MTDETNPSDPTPTQNPPPKQKRAMLTTVIVLIILLGFFWLNRQWSDNTTTTDEQPVAEQLPASQEPAVEKDESSGQVDEEASEGGDSEDEVATADSEQADGDSSAGSSDTESETSASSEGSASGPRVPPGMETISQDELPPEALETMALIETDGPFPYSKDGSTFQNREGLLPSQPNGYYSEYTVETPGSSDRGARRIVGGAEGELYYTDDHYSSFSWIEQ
jgi:ribonuclease T1